jgi:uncharacterized SAM-binding protein YcdF (DUF218 family)
MAGRGKTWKQWLPRRLRSRRGQLILAAGSVLFAAFCLFSALLFVFPTVGVPTRVDAIVVLGGEGGRLDLGEQLAHQDKASYLLLSRGLPWIPDGLCGGRVGPARVICFQPKPDTTRGEAEGASKIARNYGWSSMVLVTEQDQVWRAHLRFQRCYSGRIYGVSVPVPWDSWPYAILYQWAGTAKAEIYQRGC